jgi:hypothetical protein
MNPVNFTDPFGLYTDYYWEAKEKKIVKKGTVPQNPADEMTRAALIQHGKNTAHNFGLVAVAQVPVVGKPFVAGYAVRKIGEGYIDYLNQRWDNVSVMESGTSRFFKKASAPVMALLDLTGITEGVRSITDDSLSDEERGKLLMNSYNQLALTSIGSYYGLKFFNTKSGYVRVGRWMSRVEYENMLATNRVQEGGGGLTFASIEGPGSFMKQAPKGSVYVEYDVPANSLLPGGKVGWVKNIGPNAPKSQTLMLNKKGGEMLPEAVNIKLVMEKR